jgi:hypothetical protein
MKPRTLIASLVFILCIPALVAAAPSATKAPMAVGADLGTTSAGALMGAAAAGFSVDLPLAPAWSLDLESSGYWASGTDNSVVQINVAALARFYFMSLFIKDSARQVQWGPFLAGGAVVAWERAQADSILNVLSIGPVLRAGYRLVFGDRGIFVEPSLGWMALFGGEFAPSGLASAVNAGMTGGLTLGYRF